MDTTPFDLTPAQKAHLAALAQETGKSISMLLAEALDGLQDRLRSGSVHGEANGGAACETATQSPPSVLDIFRDARKNIPQDAWEALPTDLATQHDHYIYGTPKRPA